MAEDSGSKTIARNKKAFHRFLVLEKFEAGLSLMGSEVKSLRGGQVNFGDAYMRDDGGELFLVGLDIAPYKEAGVMGHEPKRRRKLLMHRREIRRLFSQMAVKGLTLVPLSLYFKRGLAKVEVGLCRGKTVGDKRETIKSRDARREMDREMRRRKGKR
jgi:SsrA-binding protein